MNKMLGILKMVVMLPVLLLMGVFSKEALADALQHHTKARLLKYKEDIGPYIRAGREIDFHKKFKPYEVIEMEGNLFLTAGINKIWNIVIGGVSGTLHVYDNADAEICVGDGTAAAASAQTGLQGTNKATAGMEATYPSTAAGKITLKSSFGDGTAEFDWEEWVVSQTNSNVAINRKVESLGTKASGTWTLEVDLSLA